MEVNMEAAAQRFVEQWRGRGSEKSDTQSFWLSLLRDVFGVKNPEGEILFEVPVRSSHTNFIDGYIRSTRVLIEQKSIGIPLDHAIYQSDGTKLTPVEQARRYVKDLPVKDHPYYIVTCNFSEFWIYDQNDPHAEPEKMRLDDLPKEYYRLKFLVDKGYNHTKRELEISVVAGRLIGNIYDAFFKEYPQPMSEADMRSLNILCVRLVFCLYAENAGLFGEYGMFYDYMKQFATHRLRKALLDLFHILNTEETARDRHLADDDPLLAQFPYVNGGLFAEEAIEVPPFTDAIRDTLLDEASAGFNWSDISPTIFGAVFESTLNPETRRAGGMHYTSIENIHKVIDPLFLDDLRAELDNLCHISVKARRRTALDSFQDKLASLTFFDPACGSGNFLTEAYLSLRRLENSVIKELFPDRQIGDVFVPIKVGISQFYGIEINDFAVSVAKTALWISEHQMKKETDSIIGSSLPFLPLTSQANIVEGNALRTDWESVVPREKLNYIMGNPPFVGARLMSNEQKQELFDIFPNWKNVGELDYVCCWFKKATDLMQGTTIRSALVATNSISQGEQVANLWRPLLESVHIDFAYRTFRWDSESNDKAHVHCVIVGFSAAPNDKPKVIYSEDKQIAQNINPYLLDAPNIFIDSRSKPLCEVPEIGIGNKPIDDGNYLFTAEEKAEFIKKEPRAEQYFHPWYGAYEFINNKPRYCLWLGDCAPNELRSMPECLKRVEAVRQFRLKSKSPGTVKIAGKPTRFHVENMPKGNYLLIPRVSSERRKYIPIGFMSPDMLSSDAIHLIPSATLYHFGVLTSNVHNAWMRAVCGRLKSDYRYSGVVVYNNFPWPNPTEAQREKIENTAQAILDARNIYPDASLADLYDEATMPPELRKAHEENDKAVMAAYGWTRNSPQYDSEAACVASLMALYQELTKN